MSAPADSIVGASHRAAVRAVRGGDARADDLFIGGVVDADDQAVVLYRGNFDRLVIQPLAAKTIARIERARSRLYTTHVSSPRNWI